MTQDGGYGPVAWPAMSPDLSLVDFYLSRIIITVEWSSKNSGENHCSIRKCQKKGWEIEDGNQECYPVCLKVNQVYSEQLL